MRREEALEGERTDFSTKVQNELFQSLHAEYEEQYTEHECHLSLVNPWFGCVYGGRDGNKRCSGYDTISS